MVVVNRLWAGRYRVRFLAGAKVPPPQKKMAPNPAVGPTDSHSSQDLSRG